MADTKITGLAVDTAMSSDDLMHKVDDPSGSPVNKKIAWSNLITQIETDIGKATLVSDISDNTADIATNAADIATNVADIATNAADIATNAADIVTLQAAVANLDYGQIYIYANASGQSMSSGGYTKITQFTADGNSSANISVDYANDKITINRTGIYWFFWNLSFGGTGNVIWLIAPHIGGTLVQAAVGQRTIGTGGDVGNAGNYGIYDVTSQPVDLDLRAQPNGASKTITAAYGSLFCVRLAPT